MKKCSVCNKEIGETPYGWLEWNCLHLLFNIGKAVEVATTTDKTTEV